MDPHTRASQHQASARRQAEFDLKCEGDRLASNAARPVLAEAERIVRLEARRRGLAPWQLRSVQIPGYGEFPYIPESAEPAVTCGILFQGESVTRRR